MVRSDIDYKNIDNCVFLLDVYLLFIEVVISRYSMYF